ncbi:hypothetical protein [Planobispora longispora]|uniref:Uncharacterized protein n=1 Tax=Planobispora longispora TaxID=28887 RepID=A0A8J3W4U4_9ACTN|nr:hypothetical protein [Planobispora longispora]BFE85826.1 hypothetical protein GCM10020093_084270 [Planobispora longispora]GIH76142.1 hypothetical protein Plo01_25710 [Planobispora longispora]
MNVTRLTRGAAATLSHTFYVGETATDSSVAVSASVVDASGQAVAGPLNASHSGAGTGRYTVTLPAQATLAALTVAWSATIGGQAVVERDIVEVVGGFLFSLAEARASDPIFADVAKYPLADLVRLRQEVEEECETITGRAFVPRYRRLVLDGSGGRDLVLPDGGDDLVAGILLRGVRLPIRSASIAPRVGQAAVPLTVDQLGALTVTRDGLLRRTDYGIWTEGSGNVVLEYEYGNDYPPADLKAAALLRLRSRATMARSGIPDRAISFTVAEGGTYRLSTPNASRTGIPDVDAAYDRYSRGAGGGQNGGPAPASRTLDYNPQRGSLFHGGWR